jgi:membrane-bound serine protease (ClpP class)
VLATVGVGCLVFGLATLVDGPIPELRVHTATAVGAGLGFGAISFGLAWIALRARRSKVLTGPQAMIGGTAIARTPLNPTGQVEIRGELWQASLRGQASLAIGLRTQHRRSRLNRRASQGYRLISSAAPVGVHARVD